MSTPAPERVHHPIFARLYQRVAAAAEDLGAAEHRTKLLEGVTGRRRRGRGRQRHELQPLPGPGDRGRRR